MELNIIFLILIVILTVADVFNIFSIMHYRDKIKHYHRMIERLILDDDIVESSFYTIATRYGIEEGDLRNYICEVQKKNER